MDKATREKLKQLADTADYLKNQLADVAGSIGYLKEQLLFIANKGGE